jgi:hypothetical protein
LLRYPATLTLFLNVTEKVRPEAIWRGNALLRTEYLKIWDLHGVNVESTVYWEVTLSSVIDSYKYFRVTSVIIYQLHGAPPLKILFLRIFGHKGRRNTSARRARQR